VEAQIHAQCVEQLVHNPIVEEEIHHFSAFQSKNCCLSFDLTPKLSDQKSLIKMVIFIRK
jgi:hypothetical protein